MSELDRIRWRCRRGMLELDLVLSAFGERYLEALDATRLTNLCALLERPDPELLDYVLGQADPADAGERELVTLMRGLNRSIAA